MTVGLDVVIVTHRSGGVLAECLSSLRAAADRTAVEPAVTVVDNASSDRTVEVARASWPDAEIVTAGENLGYARAANRGAAAGPAPWILFLNPDARLLPGVLEAVEPLDAIPWVDAWSPRLVGPDGTPARTAYRTPSLGRELLRLAGLEAAALRVTGGAGDELASPGAVATPAGRLLPVAYATGACLFVRRTAWDRVGPFDEGFPLYHEEMEWAIRGRRRGVVVYVLLDARATHLDGRSTDRPPPDVLEWRYRGLLRFYELHRPPWQRRTLRGALAVSYGVRSALAVNGDRAERLARVARLR